MRAGLGPLVTQGPSRMDAIPTVSTDDITYSDLPPVLLAATSDAAMDRAERTVRASGFRIGAKLPIELAERRIELQPRSTALWVEVDEDLGGPMDALLDQVARDVRDGRYAAVISTNSDVLDPLTARIDDPAFVALRGEIVLEQDELAVGRYLAPVEDRDPRAFVSS